MSFDSVALPASDAIADTIAIRAEGLSKHYRVFERPLDRLKQLIVGQRRQYGRSFTALSDVSFSLPKGSVLGVVGNNGAGKSTLLQLICNTLTPSAGTLSVNGRVAALLELGAGFNPEFSGRENIFLNAAVLGLSSEEIKARFDSIVEFSGVGDFIDQPVKTYSSGMYVRLAFSIATSVEPDILVIDEALSVGDGAFARKSFDRIMALRDAGTTILFCSHAMYHIEAICDQALWLEGGRMRMLDKPEIVTKAYAAQLLPASDFSAAQVDTPVAAQPSLAGAGIARLLEIKVYADGQLGKQLRLTAGQSELRVLVRFQFDPALPMPSVAFGIETLSGISVTSGGTLFDGAEPQQQAEGLAEVSLVFPAIALMRGRYRLTIFLACERGIHVYDHALYCAEFEVIHDGAEQGFCFIPHAWNGQTALLVPSAKR